MSHQQETTENLSGRPLLLYEISQKLSQARQAKGEDLSKPVNKLKIPINHIQALESGNWDAMPDDVYVIGFLRQYSTYLELDLSVEINRLKNSQYTLTRPLTFPDPPVAPSRRWAWLTGTAFVLLFVVFNVVDFDNSDENTVPASLNSEHITLKTTTSEQPASEQVPSRQTASKPAVATPSSVEEKTTPTRQVPSHAITNETVTSASVAVPPKPRRLTQDSTPRHFNQTKKPMKAITHTFRFEAVTAPVWIQIFLPNQAGNGKGRLLKEMLLQKGHFSTIRRATESLWITCGNTLALRIKVDRKTVIDPGELGAGKKVLRDYHFKISD